jgi:hypothetical protein
MTELLSVSPKDMWEDEQAIGKGYKKQAGISLFIVIAAVGSAYLGAGRK